MASQEASQEGSHRADYPVSCGRRQSPPGPRPSLHLRWDKLLEGKDHLTEYLRELHGLQGDAQAKAEERALAITVWIRVEDEVREAGTRGIDATGFAAALKKLKKGENSPDGLELRAHLSADVTRRMPSLDLPEEWFETTAALAPGANSLAKCRPIATLSVLRLTSVQRMESGVRLHAGGRAEGGRPCLPRSNTSGDGRDGCRCTRKSSDGKGMVSEQDPCETGKQDLGAGEPGKSAPTGSPVKPDNLRSGPRMCGQALRRAMGKERLGFLAGREEMCERELRGRHFSHQRNKARPGGHDQRHHDRTGGCWTGSRCKQNTLLIIHRKTWRDTARRHRAYGVGPGIGVRVVCLVCVACVMWSVSLWKVSVAVEANDWRTCCSRPVHRLKIGKIQW